MEERGRERRRRREEASSELVRALREAGVSNGVSPSRDGNDKVDDDGAEEALVGAAELWMHDVISRDKEAATEKQLAEEDASNNNSIRNDAHQANDDDDDAQQQDNI